MNNSISNFSGFALSRMEMKKVEGGEVCIEKGTSVDPSGTCHKVYECRHSFLGVQYGKKYAKFVAQPKSKCYSPPT